MTSRFHRSVYITLGLAAACLGYAELAYLPEISALAVVVGVLLVVAYRLEGRWSLSIKAANVLGCVIGVIAAIWVAYQFVRPYGALIDQLPSPTWLLPYLGPLLMILIPAKLFRPKHNGDFWGLQGIGLIAVALGCALTGDPLFGVLMFAYLISATWSLTLFYYYRQEFAGAGGSSQGAREVNRQRPRVAAGPRTLPQAGRWTAVVTAVALALFLCTPRWTEARWELTAQGGRLTTGVEDSRPTIDLNRSGTVAVNREKAFEVRAYTQLPPDASPKLDLDPGQRWRQAWFDSYEGGKWENRPYDAGMPFGPGFIGRRFPGGPPAELGRPRQQVLPDLGPGQYYLEFRVPTRGGPRLRADPDAEAYGPNGERLSTILMRPEGLSSRPGASGFPWTRSMEGELSPPAFALGRNESVYLQVAKPSDHPGVSGPLAYQDGYLEHLRNCQSVPKLNEWTHELFRQLAAEGRLPAAVTLDDAGRVAPQHYEAVCRAFEDYLSRSGDFKYSLTLTRADVQIDPVEDFVCNTRRGHCTRFASALALMLRSVGVPTRVVLGYRGFEQAGDGIYDVLQCHAHSWVEAIIQRPVDHGQPAADANVAQPGPVASPWRWLTLDPTPTGEEVELTEFSWGQCWEYTRQGIGTFFKNFIIEYDADQQERAKYAVSQSSWWALPTMAKRLALGPTGDDWGRAGLLAVCCVAAVVLTRRAVRRWRSLPARSANPATAFYDRMLAALRRTFGLAPRTGQTPGEFAADAGERLRAVPATCDVSGVPADAAVLYYRVRFGNRPLAAEERRALDARLDRLETALTGGAGKSAARNPSAV